MNRNDLAEILHSLASGEAPRPEWAAELRRIAAAWPASTAAPAALLKYYNQSLADDERRHLQAAVALGTGNAAEAAAAIDPALADLADFYPQPQPQSSPSTEDTIDIFLRTYGHSSPEEDALLERMIFNPVPEYAETLARDDNGSRDAAPAGSQDALIDAFLAANPVGDMPGSAAVTATIEEAPAAPGPHKPEAAAPVTPENSLLSESLAKIFIKQGRYERAYEIISNLSLNYPKKSIYFADQMRFLRKLIRIRQAGAACEPSGGSPQ